MMRKVCGVSFPRSGHHLLVRLLTHYFGDNLRFCGFYEHCRQVPCTDPLTNYQKNHDFDLALPADQKVHFIIQYRHPVESIMSWFELAVRRGWPHDVSEDSHAC